MSKTKVPDLPDVPSNIDPSLRKFCEAVRQVIQVREGVRGDALDSAVTFRDLTDGNLISVRQAGRSLIISPSTVTDLTQPPLVQDLSAAGALASIILAWLTPEYTNHAYTEIWRAQINDIAQASQVGMASGGLYVDYVARNTTGFEYYYWARNVSIYGIKGEFGIAGVLGVTSPDPAALLELLDGQLDENKLTISLQDRINLIDDSGIDLTPVNTRIQDTADLIQAQISLVENEVTATTTLLDQKIGQVELDLSNTTTSLAEADIAIIRSVDTLNATVEGNTASISTLNSSLVSTNQALVANTTTLNAKIAGNTASINTLDAGLVTTNQALASNTSSLSARINANDASITTLNSGLATTNQTLASTTTTLNANIGANTAAIEELDAGLVTTNQALTTSSSTLSARINANDASITTLNTGLASTNQALATSNTTLSAQIEDNAAAIDTLDAGLVTTNQALASNTSSLSARINTNAASITTLNTGLATTNQTLASTTTTLNANIGANTAAIEELDAGLVTANQAITTSNSTLTARINTADASIATLNTGLATTNQAISTTNTTLTARINANDASITTLNTGLATTNQTLASTTTTLNTNINTNTASITTLNAGLASTDEALATTTSALNAKIDDNTADITTLNSALVTTNQALTTSTTSLTSRINANDASITTLNSGLATTNQALATSTTQLTARLNNAAGTGVTVEQAFSAQATVNTGLNAQYTVKINNTTDKYVTGFGLAQTSVNGQTVGEFSIIADKFSIAPVATSPTASDGSPFYHITAPTTVNGVTIQPGTYMKKAFIASATIGNAEIADAAITSAKIAELQASKITFNEALGQFFSAAVIRGGSISGTTIEGNTITGGEIIGSRIRVGGTAQYPNVEISNATNSLRTYSETYLDNKPLRYSEVSDGNVVNFRLFPAGQGTFAYQPTKALTNVYSDVSNNGELVILPGFWEDQPNIIVSLSSIQLYESSLNAVDQKVVCAATNLKRLSTDPNNPGYYQYSFIPVVTLVASASDGVVPIKGQEIITNLSGSTGFAPVLGASIAAPATSSTFIMPANVSSGVITLSQDRYRCYVQGGSGNEVDVNGVESVTKLYVNNTLVFTSPAYRQSYPRDSLSPLNNYQIAFGRVPAGTAYVQTTFGEFQAHNNSSNAYNTYRLRTSIYSAINSVSVLTSSASALAQGILSWTAIGR